MWYPPTKNAPSLASTPRSSRRGHGTPRTSKKTPGNEGDLSARDKSFDADDDNRSKITVVSLKSNRTSRTVQTMQSIPEPPQSPKKRGGVVGKVKDGFREASIKRIVASGLCVATTLLLLFGVFLPFWSVYKYEVSGVVTGYYGGLWNYCEVVTGGDTSCSTYPEADNAHWFRAVRFLELMAFFGIVATMSLVTAYMFCLREFKYLYLQWIIIALCFGTGLFTLLGLIVYGACYSNSDHLSSAYGLTFCGFFGCVIAGALFLWDKIEMIKHKDDPSFFHMRGISAAQAQRAQARSRLSHVRSHRSHARSQRTQLSRDSGWTHPISQSNTLAKQSTQASARGVVLTPIERKE